MSSCCESSDDSLGHEVGRLCGGLRESVNMRLWLSFPFVASLNFLLLVECLLSLLGLLELCSGLDGDPALELALAATGAVLELALAAAGTVLGLALAAALVLASV